MLIAFALLVGLLGAADPVAAFALLHSHQRAESNSQAELTPDGAGNLYGTTVYGGPSDGGTVFKLRTDGTGFQILHAFLGGESDGKWPYATVNLDGSGNLYGTTSDGGALGFGTVFTMKADGTGFRLLHTFDDSAGGNPRASLIWDGSVNLYGTSYGGDLGDLGTVFALKTDGTGFQVLHTGGHPSAAVILDSSGTLYGTMSSGKGSVFKVKTDGTEFHILHAFNGDDGNSPRASVILDGSGNLYGTAGGPPEYGTVFKLKTDGTGFEILHTFNGTDGGIPRASVILDGSGNLYGTASWGGGTNNGTVFKVKTDGTGFQSLRVFAGGTSDGSMPVASMILDATGNLFGTTYFGGGTYSGTVFTLKTDGAGYQVLHSFTGALTDGYKPGAPLILDGSGHLYGTTSQGGASGAGTVFKVKKDGTGFALLHSFTGSVSGGRYPRSGVILDGSGNLYGTTYYGGAPGTGTVYTVKTDGTGFQLLHSFSSADGGGMFPYASLILDSSGNLYGTTEYGGSDITRFGTVFTLKTDGSGFQLLHSFSSSDVGNPYASVVLDSAGNLYGTTSRGNGTVFTVKTDGTGFQLLHVFTSGANDGGSPVGSLIMDSTGVLYGTTEYGGSRGPGTVFRLKTDGTGFQLLHSFPESAVDGQYPSASLMLDGSGNLYGTTWGGGILDRGTVFKMKPDGTEFQLMHLFMGGASDGEAPAASLVMDDDGNLYGTTWRGGPAGIGTEFVLPSLCTAPARPSIISPPRVSAWSVGWLASAPNHAGSNYTWGITNGVITAGQGTNQIMFDAGNDGPLTLTVVEFPSGGCVSAMGTSKVNVSGGTTSSFYTVTPCRVVDTRYADATGNGLGTPSLAGGASRTFVLRGACGIPSTATSVSANVTVTGPASGGFLKLFPADTVAPVASSVSFSAGQTRANNAILMLATDGTGVAVWNSSPGPVDFLLDVNGYFE